MCLVGGEEGCCVLDDHRLRKKSWLKTRSLVSTCWEPVAHRPRTGGANKFLKVAGRRGLELGSRRPARLTMRLHAIGTAE